MEVIDVENYVLQSVSVENFPIIDVENYVFQSVSVEDFPQPFMDFFLQETYPTIHPEEEEGAGGDDDEEVYEIINFDNPRKKLCTRSTSSYAIIAAESSKSIFTCDICVEPKSPNEVFSIKGCSHSYCSDCVARYIGSKLQENIIVIRCPELNCQAVLEPEICRLILPSQVFDRWCNALYESMIPASQKIYCPFKDCSALLVNDGEMVVKETECPHCRRMFCAQCKVPWHSGVVCEEFKIMNENESGGEHVMMLELAKKKHWQRCPECKFYVERSSGCDYMKCRCGVGFCYKCGVLRDPTYHHCTKYNLTGGSDYTNVINQRVPTQRKCSKCGISGHNTRTCPSVPLRAQTAMGVMISGGTSASSSTVASITPKVNASTSCPRREYHNLAQIDNQGQSVIQSSRQRVYQSAMETAYEIGRLTPSMLGQILRHPGQNDLPETQTEETLKQHSSAFSPSGLFPHQHPRSVSPTITENNHLYNYIYQTQTQEVSQQQSSDFGPIELLPHQYSPSIDPTITKSNPHYYYFY